MKTTGTKIYSTVRDFRVHYAFNLEGYSRDGHSEWFVSAAEAVFRASELAAHPNTRWVRVYEHFNVPRSKQIAEDSEGLIKLVEGEPVDG